VRATIATVHRAVYRKDQPRISESVFITTSMDDHDEKKRTERNLIVRSGKSEPEVHVTNNRRLRSTYCKGKGKGKGLDTCYSATYMSQTRDQQRFPISEVAADWHEPMVPQRIMWPSIARANGQLDPRCS